MADLDIDLVYERIADAVNDAELVFTGGVKKVVAVEFAPDSLDPPLFQLMEFTGDYDRTYGGDMEIVITARLMLARADLDGKAGQKEARKLASAGTNTIRDALNDAPRDATGHALNGACDDLHLRRVTGPRLYDYGEANFYGLEFTIFVMG